MNKKHIAIIGAGFSGAVCAHKLMEQGHQVTVFEKSRGTGGRMASTRLGDDSVDLGNPWLESEGDKDFEDWLVKQESLLPWQVRIKDTHTEKSGIRCEEVYVAKGRQSSLTRALLKGATLTTQTRVGYIWHEDDGVVVRDEHGKSIAHFDAAVVAAPAPQAVPLLEGIQRFAKRAANASTQATWVAVLKVSGQQRLAFDVLQGPHDVFKRCIHNSAKPGRGDASTWFLETTNEWSDAHIDLTKDEVFERLCEAFVTWANHHDITCEVEAGKAHRWLYASHLSDSIEPSVYSASDRMGACGDWFSTSGAVGAWRSGTSLADSILASFAPS